MNLPLTDLARQFQPEAKFVEIREWGNGNINRTYRVSCDRIPESDFILQRLNTDIFRQPEQVMDNMERVTQHMQARVQESPFLRDRVWQVPRVLPTREGKNHVIDGEGSFWRALSFIEGAHFVDTIDNSALAEEIGFALGAFHTLISDLPADKLNDTLPGFHITPNYLEQYEKVLAAAEFKPSAEVNYCLQFIRDRAPKATVLEVAKARGLLQLRPIHGDPKVNNVAIATATGRAISIIDLDTVKPGLIHYDIGDCLRSSCNPLGEETHNWEAVKFDRDLCNAVLQGYLSVANNFLTENDYRYLYESIFTIAFELGLRFFCDYLAGNIYFKTTDPEHNLRRALVQLRLAESIEKQEESLRQAIRALQ
ncbi:aminoglycoside phosphotransferase family protein [Oscillatoria sp. FACHB-1406]|uniref:phosphotransferase enzyme family protein n=1 Tax=Oscillatoria sp. FACHB-1406 TaxID=2692846 RepID=UPI001686F7CD|nr:aminoglycoside phosphotransferase family protein [Oscillatoria sp. FACHB-1406]MBD2576423.1 aminoglycoside phosphotransferase family protein [Oscillatoria sp. FACHB-1406]